MKPRREDGPRVVIMRVRSLGLAVASLGIALVGPGAGAPHLEAQSVTGAVVEVGDGSGVADARLLLLGADGTVRAVTMSGADGRFRLDLDGPGLVRLEVEHLAYAPWRTVEFSVGADEIIEVQVRLGIDAIPLEPLSVVARRFSRGRLAGFEERRTALGGFGGYFITEDEIARRPIATTTSLVRTTPGMSVARRGSGVMLQNVIMAGNCVARTFVDGIRVSQTDGGSLDDLLPPERVAGVELYPRGMSAPAQYQDIEDPGCGVVLFWTKEPRVGIVGGRSIWRVGVGFALMAGLLYVIVFGG
jgi:hypothetical protein